LAYILNHTLENYLRVGFIKVLVNFLKQGILWDGRNFVSTFEDLDALANEQDFTCGLELDKRAGYHELL
jgi:hypothetical protein